MQHTIVRTPKVNLRKPAVLAGTLAFVAVSGVGVGAVFIWLFFIPREVPADFVYTLNGDHSVNWTLAIPSATWSRIAGKAPPVISTATQRQVMKFVAEGFDSWSMDVRQCFVTDLTLNPDGSARYVGKCEWGGNPKEHAT